MALLATAFTFALTGAMHALKGKSAPLQVFGLDQEADAQADFTS
jgi:hypothetical protein